MHWFVVASQKEVRIFIKTSDRSKIELIKTVTNPLGTVKKRDLIRKEAGRGTKSLGGHLGSTHYTEGKRHDPHEEAEIQFAKEIAQFLETERLKNSFSSMTLVAEPHFLGKVKAEMGNKLQESVTDWIKKDLQKTPQSEIANFILPKSEPSSFENSI
ncbi:MAG: host attachment protein [Bdellovibrionales bacterium]|nr:host attachment protein [Bdellovibrionales bacterium]